MFRVVFTSVAIVALCAWVRAESHWPQFRGPQACGVAEGPATPISWDVATGENVRWQADVPGMAHASPIVWRDRVYVATAVGPGEAKLKTGLYGDIAAADDQGMHQWRMLALETATGRVVWEVVGHRGVPRVKRHTKASHCNSTPVTNGSRIVAIFGSEGLFCFDMDGRLVWKRDLGPMDSGYFRSPSAQWGFGSSPVIQGDKIVVLCDVQKESFLAVFELADGAEVWRTPRKDVPTWSTPTLARVGDQTQIIVNGWHHSGAYGLAAGEEIWKLAGGGDIPVPTPIIGNGLVYLTSAHGRDRPIRAIRLGSAGDITPAAIGETNNAIVWSHPRRGTYMQTPILVGEHVYACTDGGVLTCFDATSGVVRYKERLGSGQGFTASPVADGRHLYFPGEAGRVLVVPADGRFAVVATNEMADQCMATPAISEGTIFFRTEHKLVAIGHVK